MRIGIDARVLGTSRALDVYTKNIILELSRIKTSHQFVYLVNNKEQLTDIGLETEDYQIISSQPTLIEHFNFKLKILNLPAVRQGFKFDLVWHPDNREFLNCLENSVVTIHDALPLKFPRLIFSTNPVALLKQKFYYFLQRKALQKTKLVITVSQNSASDISKYYSFPPERIRVAYEGVEDRFFKSFKEKEIEIVLNKYQIKAPFIFYIGGLNAHKNVTLLIDALNMVKNRKINLVIGGKTVTDRSTSQNIYLDLKERIKNLSLQDRVYFPGFIADQDLPLFYKGALVFVYPSFYEGFGLPPLEAMASGTPVIVSNSASLPEVVGEAGILLDPHDADGFAGAIDKLAGSESLRRGFVNKGVKRATEFSWQKTAKKVLSIFEELEPRGGVG